MDVYIARFNDLHKLKKGEMVTTHSPGPFCQGALSPWLFSVLASLPLSLYETCKLGLCNSVTKTTNTIWCAMLFSSSVQKVTEPKHLAIYVAHKLMNMQHFTLGTLFLYRFFLGGNVLMTIIIYSEDVLNFLSWIVKYFEYHWKAQETEKCRKSWHPAATWRSNLI